MASMYLAEIGEPIAPNLDALRKYFGLSYTEARVACAIAKGLCPAQVAQEFGVSHETVRNQLRAVFYKTDTHTQSQVAAIVLQLSAKELAA